MCTEIEYWLAENAKRRQTGMRKQCLKRQDIHRALIEKGFDVSYSSVCKYIQRRKAEKTEKPKEVFVKQYYEPGRECEFDINHYINTLMRKPGALKDSLALRQMPERMQELFRVHFADNGKDFLRLLKFCGERKYDYNDILDAVKRIRMRGARHLNFDQIKVALETRDDAPLSFAESQKSDAFIEIELGSGDVLSQLDGIMRGDGGNPERRTAI